jgi:hypothetical protein
MKMIILGSLIILLVVFVYILFKKEEIIVVGNTVDVKGEGLGIEFYSGGPFEIKDNIFYEEHNAEITKE